MKEMIDVSRYTSYFHDGSILNIHQTEDEILISMESAELPEENICDEMILAADKRLKGILHLENPIKIQVNNNPYGDNLKMFADSGEVLDFSVTANKVQIFIEWTSYPPKNNSELYTKLEMDAKKIFWENKPDLS